LRQSLNLARPEKSGNEVGQAATVFAVMPKGVGGHSIRGNNPWRLCLVWSEGGMRGVEIVVTHRGAVRLGKEDWSMGRVIRRVGLDEAELSDVATGERLAPVTPGDVLQDEFMVPLGLSARAVAQQIGVLPNRVMGTLNGKRAVSAATALLLEARFGASMEFWMNLRTAHDLEVAPGRVVAAA